MWGTDREDVEETLDEGELEGLVKTVLRDEGRPHIRVAPVHHGQSSEVAECCGGTHVPTSTMGTRSREQ